MELDPFQFAVRCVWRQYIPLAPAILYIAVLVAIGMPMKKKTAQILLCMALVSGAVLVFSKTDMTD